MGDQNTILLALIISTSALWILVLWMAGLRVREYFGRRRKIRAVVLDDAGEVRQEAVLDRQKELIIGKSTPAGLVHIDFADSKYAPSIEEEHASFFRYQSSWYVRADAKNGMVGLKQKGKETVYKLRRGIPYRIVPGDIVYISYEKIILR